MLNRTLKVAGLPAPYTDAGAVSILRDCLLDYPEGHIRMAAASADASDENRDGRELIQQFRDCLKDILENPEEWGAKLDEDGATPADLVKARSYQINNTDGLSVENGDFDPRFKIEELVQ